MMGIPLSFIFSETFFVLSFDGCQASRRNWCQVTVKIGSANAKGNENQEEKKETCVNGHFRTVCFPLTLQNRRAFKKNIAQEQNEFSAKKVDEIFADLSWIGRHSYKSPDKSGLVVLAHRKRRVQPADMINLLNSKNRKHNELSTRCHSLVRPLCFSPQVNAIPPFHL